MTYIGNTAQAYSQDETTVREDLADLIAIMSPVDMPLFSILAHTPIYQRKFEWAMDNIPFDNDPGNIGTYTQFEGKDASFEAAQHRERPWNLAQINSIAVDVSDTARVVDMVGTEDEFEYQIWRRLLELGRRMEFAAHWAGGRETTAGQNQTNLGRVTHGLCRWIAQTGLKRAQGAASEQLFTSGPTITSDYFSTFYDAAGTDLSRSILFNNILAPAWRNGFNVGGCFIFSGAQVKQFATEFSVFGNTSLNFRQVAAEAKILYDTIDVIDTNLGPVYWNLDRYLDINQSITLNGYGPTSPFANITVPLNETLIAIEPRFFQLGMLRGVGFKPLAPVGDSTKGLLVGEWGLKCLNPIAGTGGTNLVA